MRFEVETDRPLIANDSMTRYVLATIVAREGAPRQRPPVNLGLVIDRSGSMGGDKIRLAKDAAVAAIRRLDSRDRFCVVTYDDVVDVVVPSTAATRAGGRGTPSAPSCRSRRAAARTSAAGWLRGLRAGGAGAGSRRGDARAPAHRRAGQPGRDRPHRDHRPRPASCGGAA